MGPCSHHRRAWQFNPFAFIFGNRMKIRTRISLLACATVLAASASAQTLLNASYDVAREFYKDYNAAFVAHYKKTTGKDVKVDQAHGGSSAQARAVEIHAGPDSVRIGDARFPGRDAALAQLHA